jgi:hypothetical protein
MQATNGECIRTYGFVANTDLHPARQRQAILANTPKAIYFQRMQNDLCHDLCTERTPPPQFKTLLCLGAKFCIQRRRPKPIPDGAFLRMQRDTRLRYFFANKRRNTSEDDYNPKLYVKSNWRPPHANFDVEIRICEFEKAMRRVAAPYQAQRQRSNLTKVQQALCNTLRNHPDFVVALADKNMGPCIIERAKYADHALLHLQDESTYLRLSPEQAQDETKQVQDKIRAFVERAYTTFALAPEEIKFIRAHMQDKRIARFYLTMKVHKKPLATRPIVSTIGSPLYGLSKWVDYWLQQVARKVPSYLRDSFDTKCKLQALGPLPTNARLFTMDAVSMYTNIDIDHSIASLRTYLPTIDLPANFPTDEVLEGLRLVMENNIFQFGDTYWRQLIGSAMGTPTACSSATIYFAPHEAHLLERFRLRLPWLARFIDDGIGLWLIADSKSEDKKEWSEFTTMLDAFGKLRWTANTPTFEVQFLDMTVAIVNGCIETKTYEKPGHPHLYIPAHSAHPPGCLRGLISGSIHRFKRLNTRHDDYRAAINRFYARILARGYTRATVDPLFEQAARRHEKPKLRFSFQPTAASDEESEQGETLFFHIEYHPRDVSRRAIQETYAATCCSENAASAGFSRIFTEGGGEMKIIKFMISYKRPQNLRDVIIPSSFFETDQVKISRKIAPTAALPTAQGPTMQGSITPGPTTTGLNVPALRRSTWETLSAL